jgi:D-alanyl-D-alanine carboxypeptidase
MKIYINALMFVVLSGCSNYITDLEMSPCTNPVQSSGDKADKIRTVLRELVTQSVPGVSMAMYSDETGWIQLSEGVAKIENNTPMQSCNLQYLQSVAKTYMAVGILKLFEQGKIDLDAPMTNYLPKKYSVYISGADKITVKMLLNHTSGIPEYNSEPLYITRLLQDPDYKFSASDYLRYIEGKPLTFAPGSRYSYRNTNYVLLALIADEITGDHAKFLSEIIFQPLGLTSTFYRNEPGYLKYPQLVNSYWDRHSDGIIENASVLQRNNVAALIGDDGIVATPEDAVRFLKGLFEGKIISTSTLTLMQSWVNDREGKPTYGLGLDHAEFIGHEALGHSGGGIGAGCQLYYFPEKKIYVFVGINLGTVTDSPIHKKASETIDKIYRTILD